MKHIIKRLKSKTYVVNIIAGIGAVAAANAGVLGITPQGVVALAVVNLVLRELTTKPLREK